MVIVIAIAIRPRCCGITIRFGKDIVLARRVDVVAVATTVVRIDAHAVVVFIRNASSSLLLLVALSVARNATGRRGGGNRRRATDIKVKIDIKVFSLVKGKRLMRGRGRGGEGLVLVLVLVWLVLVRMAVGVVWWFMLELVVILVQHARSVRSGMEKVTIKVFIQFRSSCVKMRWQVKRRRVGIEEDRKSVV